MGHDRTWVIAGGGPTGLMLAGELALVGVDVAIVERIRGMGGRPDSGGAPRRAHHLVPSLTSPRDEPWGMREFTMRDPAGNLIRIGHEPVITADRRSGPGLVVED